MKRSEAVLKLLSFIEANNENYLSGEEAADGLLEFVEKLGMKPPGYSTKYDNGDYTVFSPNRWEPEDSSGAN